MVRNYFPKSYRCAFRIRDNLQVYVHYEIGGDELTSYYTYLEECV